MNDEMRAFRRRAGLAESNLEQSYSDRLRANNYTVTPDQAASNMHLLNRLIPLDKALGDFLFEGNSSMLTRDEREVLNRAKSILKSLMIPQALLNVQEKTPNSLGKSLFKK